MDLAVPSAPVVRQGTPWSHVSLDEACAAVVNWSGGHLGTSPDIEMAIGGQPAPQAVSVGGSDWLAHVDQPQADLRGEHPLGAMAAACFGAARAFHLALGRRIALPAVPRNAFELSLLTYRQGTTHAGSNASDDIMPVTLVGAGAVGQAFLWCCVFSNFALTNRLDIVDPQSLDETNLNRHLVSGREDVGKAKAAIAAAFVGTVIPAVRAFVCGFDEYRREFAVADAVVSTVDNNDARYQIQGSFPRYLLHGATSQEIFSVASLDPLEGACLGCLFPQRARPPAIDISEQTGIPAERVAEVLETDGVIMEDMLPPLAARLRTGIETLSPLLGRSFREVYAKEICGRLGGGLGDASPSPTVAYVSALSGLLLLGELVKISSATLAEFRLRNYLQMATLHPESAWIASRAKDPDCPLMCSSDALQQFVRSQRFASAPNP